MIDQDTLRKAVELADGWSITGKGRIVMPQPDGFYIDWPHLYLADYPESLEVVLDALAAQLVRQVVENDIGVTVEVYPDGCSISLWDQGCEKPEWSEHWEGADYREGVCELALKIRRGEV